MSEESPAKQRYGFCIFINIFFQGATPAVSDEDGYIVFESELEAQKEIADHQMTRLREFLDGERDFEDAIEVDEFIMPVNVRPDGVIIDNAGNCFSPRPE